MGIQTPMAQGRSTKIISIIKWTRAKTLSMKNSLSNRNSGAYNGVEGVRAGVGLAAPQEAMPGFGFRVSGSGFRVQGLEFRV